MIKIAFVIDTISSDMAGTEKQLLGIIARLRAHCSIRIVCLYGSTWLEENPLQVPIDNLGYTGLFRPGVINVIRRLATLIDREGIHIVQTFFEDSIFIGLLGKALSKSKPVLISSRRDLGLGKDEPYSHWFFNKLKPFVMQYFDGVAVNAVAIRSRVAQYEAVTPEKITVIPNGLSISQIPDVKPKIFTQYNDSIWIGITANLKPVKRVDLFIKAIAIARDYTPLSNIRGVILGSGRLKPELEALARELGIEERIHFAGSTSCVEAYLENLDIGVLCSDNEGLSNAILEYMASGLPVVATAVGGNCELVDYTNGICVPPGDAGALGDALARLAQTKELRRQMGAHSLAKIRDHYTWEKIVPQWLGYYRSLVAHRPSPKNYGEKHV